MNSENKMNSYKKAIISFIGLIGLVSLIIALNIQVGFTALENIEHIKFFFIFLLCIFMVIITIIITIFIFRYELRHLSKIEEENNKKEEINKNAL